MAGIGSSKVHLVVLEESGDTTQVQSEESDAPNKEGEMERSKGWCDPNC